jgi:hypothetical protein
MRGLMCVLGCLFLLIACLPATADAQCPRCGSVPSLTCDPQTAPACDAQPTPADPIVTTAPVTVAPRVERSILVRRPGPFWRRGPVRRAVSWSFRAVGRRCG